MEAIARAVLWEIESLRKKKNRLLIAIDGRCAAGKTTLAALLQKACECNVIHTDHFYLRPEQRNIERLTEPGGNIDYERFVDEVFVPLKKGQAFSYRPFDCQELKMSEAIPMEPSTVNVIEGAYSCHPLLYEYYDFRIFLTVDSREQMRRVINRNGVTDAAVFKEKWIPMEERYFTAYRVNECCELCFET